MKCLCALSSALQMRYFRNFAFGEYSHALRLTVGATIGRPRANAVRPYERMGECESDPFRALFPEFRAMREYSHALRLTVGATISRPQANAVCPYERAANANRIPPRFACGAGLRFVRSTSNKKAQSFWTGLYRLSVWRKERQQEYFKITYRQRFFQQAPQFYR